MCDAAYKQACSYLVARYVAHISFEMQSPDESFVDYFSFCLNVRGLAEFSMIVLFFMLFAPLLFCMCVCVAIYGQGHGVVCKCL